MAESKMFKVLNAPNAKALEEQLNSLVTLDDELTEVFEYRVLSSYTDPKGNLICILQSQLDVSRAPAPDPEEEGDK